MSQSTESSDWQSGKRRHLELSAVAAPHYDEIYKSSNFATGSYMEYEVQALRELSKVAPDSRIAIDIVCGTGRHSLELAKHFDQVFGVDFSPEMIRSAEHAKAKSGVGNVAFAVADAEHGLSDFGQGRASLVSCSFGMASFVEHLPHLFKTVRLLLKPQGVAAFSLYNSDALVNRLELQWKPALAARLVPGKNLLSVDFDGIGRIKSLDPGAFVYQHHSRATGVDIEGM